MEFLDPVKKRAHGRRLFIGYFLVAMAIAAALWLLVLYASGYDINHKTGQIVQNGIVLVSSHPVSADVYLNGVKKGTTSIKLNIQSGTYNLRLSQSGYRDWQRSFSLDGGTVVQIRYPFLFPTNLVTSDVKTYSKPPTFATQSPDNRWLLIQPSGNLTHFDVFDLSNASAASPIDLPAGLLTKASGTQSLKVIEWSSDNRHILIRHDFHGGREFVMIDRLTPAASVNLNQLFKLSPNTVALRGKSADQLYIFISNTQQIRTASIKTKISRPLFNKVLYFKSFGSSQLVYITPDAKNKSMNSLEIWDSQRSYLLHEYPAGDSYLIAMSSFNGSDFLALSPQKSGIVYIYQNPLAQAKAGQLAEPFKTLRLKQTNFLSFSAASRFIVAQSGRYFAVYDIDNDSRHYFSLNQNISSSVMADWMDDDHLDIVNQNKIEVFDFDGTNRQTLNDSLAGFTPYFNPAYDQLFSVSRSSSSARIFALTQSSLKLK